MYFIPEAIRVEFELSSNIEPVAILVMGYVIENKPIVQRKKRDFQEYVLFR